MEERPDLEPCHNVMQDIAEVEESSSTGQVPAVTFEVHEAKSTMSQSHDLLEENELMQQNTSAHVRDRDTAHKHERTNDEALRP